MNHKVRRTSTPHPTDLSVGRQEERYVRQQTPRPIRPDGRTISCARMGCR